MEGPKKIEGTSSLQYRPPNSKLPSNAKSRLYTLFRELEKEFESLYVENVQLREKISDMEKGFSTFDVVDVVDGKDGGKDEYDGGLDKNGKSTSKKSFTAKTTASKTRYKLKAHTSKIVSSFKTPSVSCSLVGEFKGHRDGLWDIDASNIGTPIIGTASADKTVRIWNIETGKCLLSYTAHSGSVNGLSFHPVQDLVLSASGDGTAHLWKAAIPNIESGFHNMTNPPYSSDDSSGESSDDPTTTAAATTIATTTSSKRIVRNPISVLTGHSGVVIACHWFCDDRAVTASWDRTANLYDVVTGTLLQTLAGHDDQLSHVTCHPRKRLVATCSRDSTFRLWDFRETIHSVSVFQGHTESVTCAAFARSDQIVSGSDDRTVKVWDLRNMRAPTISIQTSSPVNRLSVSKSGVIAIPHDNRHIVLYDLNASGQKLFRLPRESAKSHHRMVTAAHWTDHSEHWKYKSNLFTAGFDRIALGWSIKGVSKEELKPKSEHKVGTSVTAGGITV